MFNQLNTRSTARLMMAPAVILLLGWMLAPLTTTLYFSFKKYLPLRGGDLGWVGFDPTNKCSPDERYVRVSCGLDASYASPIKGVFYGNINNDAVIENLDIHVQTLENNSQQ